VRVLVTGADGFVGRVLVRRLAEAGHAVVGARRPEGPAPDLGVAVEWRPLELDDADSVAVAVAAAVAGPLDAAVHLAAVASGGEARRDPGRAWTVNAAGTARLAEALAARGDRPRLLLVSTGEVYGAGPGETRRPRTESDPPLPRSPYAASKLGAEVAAQEVARRTGLPVVVARPFAHTGAGQRADLYVAPAFAARLREAARTGAARVPTGNLEPVRDFLDVRDVAEAYLALLERGEPGETYNVARGEGISLRELFERLAALVGVRAEPTPDPALARAADIPYLVGDAAKLRRATGWAPTIPLDDTLRNVADAQAD
jgi:GDP-4-dehydro-6-deoxy-D-mannose reductase